MIRGVSVPAGTHRVEFRYEPASWRAGWIVSGLALLTIAVAAAIGWRRRRRPGEPVHIGGNHRYVRGVSAPWMSVVVPAYNEEAGIAKVIAALHERLGGFGRPYEIIVVDNASQDSTVEVLQPLLDGDRVRVLRNNVNRGKGSRSGAECSTQTVS